MGRVSQGSRQRPTSFSGAPRADKGTGWLETVPCWRGPSALESGRPTPAVCVALTAGLMLCFSAGQFPSLAGKEHGI